MLLWGTKPKWGFVSSSVVPVGGGDEGCWSLRVCGGGLVVGGLVVGEEGGGE